MPNKRTVLSSVFTLTALIGFGCGGSSEEGYGTGSQGSGTTGISGGSQGSTTSASTGGGSATGGSGSRWRGADPNTPPPIPGGGTHSAPLGAGCGPETANECHPVGGDCNPSTLVPDYRLVAADSICFYAEAAEQPSALVEYVTEFQNGKEYLHLRVTFDPSFVDTVYGACAASTGWGPDEAAATTGTTTTTGGKPGMKPPKAKGGHTFDMLVGSDHVELMLNNCAGELSMHMKLDFIDELATTGCGYGSGGVTSGEGKMIVGSADHVLASSSSLSRNMNGCGYCETVESPCPGEGYTADPNAPEWDFRVYYEVWIDAAAFGGSGFCGVDVNSVHASPSKADSNTVLVEPGDCPPPPCPPNYELYLTSEGEGTCVPTGGCPPGYVIDLMSEGESFVPAAAPQ